MHQMTSNKAKERAKCVRNHDMEIFSTFLALCEWNSPVTSGFPSYKGPIMQRFDVFFVVNVLNLTVLQCVNSDLGIPVVVVAQRHPPQLMQHSLGKASSLPIPIEQKLKHEYTLRLRQDGRHFPENIFKCIFFQLTPAVVLIMAWRHTGNKPLSDPMMVSLSMHICVTRPQGVKSFFGITPA